MTADELKVYTLSRENGVRKIVHNTKWESPGLSSGRRKVYHINKLIKKTLLGISTTNTSTIHNHDMNTLMNVDKFCV